jgi:penicillin amidase
MNKISKGILGTIIILVPALVAIAIIFNNLSNKSFYPDSGEIQVNGLLAKVRIYSDEFGVPHIFAENEHDLYFSMGYLHARDRLWQMDVMRRAAEGRLSEVFGSSTIEYDKLFRTIGINRTSYSMFNNISQKSRDILRDYSQGVNKFVEMHRKQLPIEFDILNCQPEEWKPEHSLMVGRLMAWDLNLNWHADYAWRKIVGKVGIEKAAEIFPDTNLVPRKKFEPPSKDTTVSELQGTKISPMPPSKGETSFLETYISYRGFFGLNNFSSGSNSWVIAGSKSESGKPILANDPHLSLQSPSKWHEVHLKSGDIDVTGMSLPGVPAVIIGHNRVISWGLTNLMCDDNDFVPVERSIVSDSTIEKIGVRDSSEVYVTVRRTVFGPVVSDFRTGITAGDRLSALRWTGYESSDELKTFYILSRAKDWEEFKSGLKGFGSPAQNFIYADTAGNIGYQLAGKIPVRKNHQRDEAEAVTGEDSEWMGFIEFEKLPGWFNPSDSFIATANTNPFELRNSLPFVRGNNSPYYISWTWEPSSRLDRIKEMLRKKSKFSVDEFRLMQMDYVSLYAKDIAKYLLEAFEDCSNESPEVRDALNRMQNWDGMMKPELPEGAIFNVFFVNLLRNIYEDELGEEIFYDFLMLPNIPYRSTARLLKEPNSLWFNSGTRDELIKKGFRGAVSFLISHFGTNDVSAWKWGELHQLRFMHPMGKAAALDKTFNIGPYQVGGDHTTVNNSGFSLVNALKHGTFETDIGPSMRMITDMADVQHSLSINSTGQSGQPTHPNYSDQSRLWFYGEYKEGAMDEFEMLGRGYKLLVLNP